MTILTWTIAFDGNKLSWRERGSDLEMEEDSKNVTGVKNISYWKWECDHGFEKQRGASMVSSRSAVSLLHTDLQVENFQRCKRVFHQCQAWMALQLSLRLLLLTVLQLSNLPASLPPPVLLACSLDASPCIPAVVLYYCSSQGTVL